MPIQARVPTPATITAEELAALIAERDALAGALRVATTERDLALERLRSLQRQLFAAKSEARGTDQKDLFLNEAEALAPTDQTPQAEVEDIDEEESTPVAGHQRKKRGRKPLDPALPREILRHELPEAERVCAHDGHALVEIGAEVSEQMDVIPEQVRVLQHHRIKYACPCCDQSLKVAPTPARIIPRGLLTEQAQAWVITGKYQFGMPLYRTAVLLRRFGGDIASNTLASGIVRIGQAVQPVINLLRDHLLDSDLIYGDETTVQVLKEPGRKAQTKSFMWAQMNGTGPPVRLFAYAPGRGAVHAEKLYAGIRPGTTLVTDGYEVYNGIAKAGGLTHLGCWVHARRPFIKAEESIPKAARSPNQLASRFVRLIGKLYRAEALAKDWTPGRRCDCVRATAAALCARSSSCCSRTCTASRRRACWAKRCTTCMGSGPSSCGSWTTGLGRWIPTRWRTRSGRSLLEDGRGCLLTPWAARMPAPIFTPSSRQPRPTTSSLTATSSRC
jgi:transposase